MANIKKLKDNNNNTVYPMTHASAVFLNNEQRLSDCQLVKIAPNMSTSAFQSTLYYNDDGSPIKDPVVYITDIIVNGQKQTAYLFHPLNGSISQDFNDGLFLSLPLGAVSFTDGTMYASAKEFSFVYDASSNSASLERGQNYSINSLQWTII